MYLDRRIHDRRLRIDSLRPNDVSNPMRILAFAYACEPARGSEPGAGWAWTRMLARLGETWVITRRDYQASIEEALLSVPERQQLKFVYVELPERFRSWQRDLRGLRIYYLLWQIAALKEARRLRRSVRFDLVWHLTWANAWFGSTAALAGRPFVYGPVGGCVGPVWRLVPRFGWRGGAFEIARSVVRGTARYVNPLARLSWSRADLILAQNVETRNWFPRRHRGKTSLFPNAVIRSELMGAATPPVRTGPPTVLYAGRLEPFKGVFLCLRALVLLPGWRLVVCGSGTDEQRLQRLARRLGVVDRVDWLGWLPQDEVLHRMAEADVFLFASVHEEAPAVIAEARAVGLPFVCLARGGPPLLAGPADTCVADSGGAGAVAARLADAVLMSAEQRRRGGVDHSSADSLLLDRRAEAIRELLSQRLPWTL
jgi:glycosyltransferase involved in cell wall biosynthesis